MSIDKIHDEITNKWMELYYKNTNLLAMILGLENYFINAVCLYNPKPIKIRIFNSFIETNLSATIEDESLILRSCGFLTLNTYYNVIGKCQTEYKVHYRIGTLHFPLIGRYKMNGEFIYCSYPPFDLIYNLAKKDRQLVINKFVNLVNWNNYKANNIRSKIEPIVDYILSKGSI